MKAVVQRVLNAAVKVDERTTGSIASGLLVYLGVAQEDSEADADWLAAKIAAIRIFDDADGKMNLSLKDIVSAIKTADTSSIGDIKTSPISIVTTANGAGDSIGVLAVSQFTLLGDARKGNRPSWNGAAQAEQAKNLYGYFMQKIREQGLYCASGEFQAHMQVTYTNDGPVTILLDSRNR